MQAQETRVQFPAQLVPRWVALGNPSVPAELMETVCHPSRHVGRHHNHGVYLTGMVAEVSPS